MRNMETFKEKAKNTTVRFNQICDELRVKSHLLGMEMKDTTDELRGCINKINLKVQRFGELAETNSDELRLKGHLGVMEAKQQLDDLKDDLKAILHVSKGKIGQGIDEARLKNHLAKMEAKDYLDEKKAEWRKEIAKAERDLARKNLDQIDEILDDLQ